MSTAEAKSPSGAATITVRVGLISWVNQLVGGNGAGTTEFSQQAPVDSTVYEVLDLLARRHPKLRATLWDEDDHSRIGPHIEVIVNDAILGVTHHLDTPLRDGDEILLTGQYIGG